MEDGGGAGMDGGGVGFSHSPSLGGSGGFCPGSCERLVERDGNGFITPPSAFSLSFGFLSFVGLLLLFFSQFQIILNSLASSNI